MEWVVGWCFVLIAAAVWGVRRLFRSLRRTGDAPAGETKAKARARSSLPRAKGWIPPRATFTGVRGMPWVVVASNSLHPVFRIEDGQLIYRVLRLQQRPLSDIESVDVRTAWGTFNLIFAFHGTSTTFIANVGTAARGARALAHLPDTVALSERARAARQAPDA